MSPPLRYAKLDAIAKAAGVHRSTASHVLSGSGKGRASAATVVRVLAAVSSLSPGNEPVPIPLIGLISRVGHHWSRPPLFEDLEDGGPHPHPWDFVTSVDLLPALAGTLAAEGWGLSLADSYSLASESGASILSTMAGAIVQDDANRDWATLRCGLKGPVVLLNWTGETNGEDEVNPDDRGGIAAASAHLFSLGHRRLAWVKPEMTMHARSHIVRQNTLQEAVNSIGGTLAVIKDSEFPVWSNLYSSNDGPTAVMCYDGRQVLATLASLTASGRRVPEDVSLICGDDQPLCQRLGITAVHIPIAEGAVAAGQLILNRLAGRLPPPPVRLLLPETLIIRSTTGTARA